MTLTEFLLARIAEDERDCELASSRRPFDGVSRWIDECSAKRAIVEDYALLAHQGTIAFPGPNAVRHFAKVDVYYDVLQHLAAVYSDHPDYREEWRP